MDKNLYGPRARFRDKNFWTEPCFDIFEEQMTKNAFFTKKIITPKTNKAIDVVFKGNLQPDSILHKIWENKLYMF